MNFAAIENIQARQLAFLLDEVLFYTSKNRATLGKTDFCSYQPTENSPGCAIGRHLDRENHIIVYNENLSVSFYYGKKILPEWMEQMGSHFLTKCQYLHDFPVYWNENGLSGTGKKFVQEIIRDVIGLK